MVATGRSTLTDVATMFAACVAGDEVAQVEHGVMCWCPRLGVTVKKTAIYQLYF